MPHGTPRCPPYWICLVTAALQVRSSSVFSYVGITRSGMRYSNMEPLHERRIGSPAAAVPAQSPRNCTISLPKPADRRNSSPDGAPPRCTRLPEVDASCRTGSRPPYERVRGIAVQGGRSPQSLRRRDGLPPKWDVEAQPAPRADSQVLPVRAATVSHRCRERRRARPDLPAAGSTGRETPGHRGCPGIDGRRLAPTTPPGSRSRIQDHGSRPRRTPPAGPGTTGPSRASPAGNLLRTEDPSEVPRAVPSPLLPLRPRGPRACRVSPPPIAFPGSFDREVRAVPAATSTGGPRGSRCPPSKRREGAAA